MGAFYYKPTDSKSFQETLDSITKGLNLAASIGIQNVPLLGIFNARQVTWVERNNNNGINLEEFMRRNNLNNLNNEQPTFLCVGGSSKIDLVNDTTNSLKKIEVVPH